MAKYTHLVDGDPKLEHGEAAVGHLDRSYRGVDLRDLGGVLGLEGGVRFVVGQQVRHSPQLLRDTLHGLLLGGRGLGLVFKRGGKGEW
jgi:hypothetical protein